MTFEFPYEKIRINQAPLREGRAWEAARRTDDDETLQRLAENAVLDLALAYAEKVYHLVSAQGGRPPDQNLSSCVAISTAAELLDPNGFMSTAEGPERAAFLETYQTIWYDIGMTAALLEEVRNVLKDLIELEAVLTGSEPASLRARALKISTGVETGEQIPEAKVRARRDIRALEEHKRSLTTLANRMLQVPEPEELPE